MKTAMLKVISDVLNAFNHSKVMILALLYLSAVFNSEDHNILLQYLHDTYDLCGSVLA